jgi:hypothetical protein
MHILAKMELEFLKVDSSSPNHEPPVRFSFKEIEDILEKYPICTDPKILRPEGRYFKNSERKQILQAWHEKFPETYMHIGKNLGDLHTIRKIIGPLSSGFFFDFHFRRNYCTVYHIIENLLLNREEERADLFVSIFRGVFDEIKVGTWEADNARLLEIALRRKNRLIPLSGDVTLDDIFRVYDEWSYSLSMRDVSQIATPMLTAAWCGEIKKAEQYYEYAVKKLTKEFLYIFACKWINELLDSDKVKFIDQKPFPMTLEESFEKTIENIDKICENIASYGIYQNTENCQSNKNAGLYLRKLKEKLDTYKEMIYEPEKLRQNYRDNVEAYTDYTLTPFQQIKGSKYHEK